MPRDGLNKKIGWFEEKTSPTKELIGIMADSHGQPDVIQAALGYFARHNCRRIYHLGDICDSVHPETAEACVRPLLTGAVAAVKGNNDHAIALNCSDRKQAPLSAKSLDFLKNLPLVLAHRNALFAHSLPFARKLGLSCMIGSMGSAEAQRFFAEFPQHILFRGHSHAPRIIRQQGHRITAETLRVGQIIALEGCLPCVVTCGALSRRLAIVWRPEDNLLECISF